MPITTGSEERKMMAAPEDDLVLGFEEASRRRRFFDLCSEHITHAREKHPGFVHDVTLAKDPKFYFSFYASQYRVTKHETLETVAKEELFEFLEALNNGDYEHAKEEAADLVAVIYRALYDFRKKQTKGV